MNLNTQKITPLRKIPIKDYYRGSRTPSSKGFKRVRVMKKSPSDL